MAATEKTGTHTWAEQEASIENAKTSAAMLTALGMTADQVSALSGANAPSGTNVVATMADIPDVPEIPSQANMPTSDQKSALTGTSGTPSASNPYATKATTDAEASARTSGDALALKIASNLSDLNSAVTARTNLGLGTAAVTESTAYATAAQGALADSAVQPAAIVDQTFAAAVSTNPYSATPALTPRRIGDRAYNTTSLEWWDGIATAGATTSWQLSASGGSGSGDMTRAVYDTANRGYVDRAVLADTATTATTAGTITGQGDAATKNVGTTAGTVAAGDDSRIVAGGTALQPTGDGSGLTGITASQVGAATAAQGATADSTASALTSHTGNTSNPHAVTKAQVGLPNVVNPTIYGGQLITDWNALTYTGPVTAYSTATGAPFASESAWGLHINSNAGNLYDWQFAVGYTTGLQVSRRKVNNTWEAWSSGVTATELAYVHGATSALQPQINLKAPLASPSLTGTPTAPTAAVGTNTNQLATTAFVLANAGTTTSTCSSTTGLVFTTSTGYAVLADFGKNHIENVGKDGFVLKFGVTTPADITGTQYLIATLAGEAGTSGWAVKLVSGVLYFGRGISTGPEWCNTGVTLSASTKYEIRLQWVATSTAVKLTVNGTLIAESGMTNGLTTAAWVDCTNKLYFGSDASGANNVKTGCVIHDKPELYNYVMTDAQWTTWVNTCVAPTTGYGTMNVVPNYDFVDGSNDWFLTTSYTTSVTDGVLSFQCTVENPIPYSKYISFSYGLFYPEQLLTYTATARVRRASGTTGSVGFGFYCTALTTLTPAAGDTDWHIITTTYTPANLSTPGSLVGIYGTTTASIWEMDYLIISRAGNLLEGLEFSAQPMQAHAANGAFWTLSNANPWPNSSARIATLKTQSVIIADGALGITMPANWRPLAVAVRNTGTTTAGSIVMKMTSISGAAFTQSVSPGIHVGLAAGMVNSAVISATSQSVLAVSVSGLVTGNRIWVDMQICR